MFLFAQRTKPNSCAIYLNFYFHFIACDFHKKRLHEGGQRERGGGGSKRTTVTHWTPLQAIKIFHTRQMVARTAVLPNVLNSVLEMPENAVHVRKQNAYYTPFTIKRQVSLDNNLFQ